MMRIVSAACRLVVFALAIVWAADARAQTLAEQQAVMAGQAELQGQRGKAAQGETNGEANGDATDSQDEDKSLDELQEALTLYGFRPGIYISLFKIACYWFVFVLWVWTTDWVSRECRLRRLNYSLWNSVVLFPFVVAFFLMLAIPVFMIGFSLMLLAWGGTLAAFILTRNQAVQPHERVMTWDHLRYLVATNANRVGMKMEVEKRAAHERGAPVDLLAMGGDTQEDNNANLFNARQSLGYVTTKDLIADAVALHSHTVLLDFTREAVGVRYQIDGVWHNREPRDRESGDLMLAVMKTLSAVDAQERRQKQSGKFAAKYNGTSYFCSLTSQGTQTGERVALTLEGGSEHYQTLEELGIRDKVRERFLQFVGANTGFVLFCAPPANGLTTMIDIALEETDRLLRNFASVEEESHREKEIQNVDVTTYNAAAGETPATVLPKLIRTYPDVLVVRDLVDAETVRILCEQAGEVQERLVLASVRAKEAAEALLRVLMMKVPAKEFAPVATAVLNVRLVRKLCPACKVAYEPPPQILKKLGIPAGRIQALHREPKPDEREDGKPCAECQGIGYRGRTGIYELLVVDDKIRELLIKQPKLDLLKKASRQAGQRSLQEEGIVLVAKGITSLPELMRVLKQ